MTKKNYRDLVDNFRKLIKLIAIEESKNVQVTFWPDNYDDNVFKTVDSEFVGELLTQKQIQKIVTRKMAALDREGRKISNKFPKKIRLKVKRRALAEARSLT